MDAIPTDAELLVASDHDAQAFRTLYDRHAPSVFAFLSRRVSAADAFDLVAETFAAAWLSRHRFEDRRDGSARPWLMGIARNVWMRSLRTARTEQRARERLGLLAVDQAVEPPSEPPPDDPRAEPAVAALNSLPFGQREAVQLRVVGDLDYADVAERLDCTPLAARIRVSRGLGQIRRTLNEDHHG